MPGAIHHSVVLVRDLGESLRFYHDGLGLDILQDHEVEGEWPTLFGGPSRRLRVVFLGDRNVPDISAGALELNTFVGGEVDVRPPAESPQTGLFMLSFFVDVEATVQRLAHLGLGGEPRRVSQSTPNGRITIVTVRDPDEALILLTPGSITKPN